MRRRGYRGWIAATTVAVTLSLVFLAVEKHLRTAPLRFGSVVSSYNPATTTERPGILLTVDPGLASIDAYLQTDAAEIGRTAPSEPVVDTTQRMRRPPEPAATVVLHAPVADDAFASLPLFDSKSNVDFLMEAMDEAFRRPLHIVTATNPVKDAPTFPLTQHLESQRLVDVPPPVSIVPKMPEPSLLLETLNVLEQRVSPASARGGFVTTRPLANVSNSEARAIDQWIDAVRAGVARLTIEHGLEHPASQRDIEELQLLASQTPSIGNELTDYSLASDIIRTGYALQRHVSVWKAIQGCLDGTTIALSRPRDPDAAREDLLASIAAVEAKLGRTGDGQMWRDFLLLNELTSWAKSSDDIWRVGEGISTKVLKRLHWPELNRTQQSFLSQPEFSDLAAHLVVWGRDPIDYRQFLATIEEIEADPISREGTALAGAIQVLRLSSQRDQQNVSAVVNQHYRNANIRLSVAGQLLERFLPEGDYEVRPIRRSILGADTSGDSAVHTKLKLGLIPDNSRWNLDVGVEGDVYSRTRSSKGPAVLYNTSTAQIDSHRYITISPEGYSVSAQPTNVDTQDYLRNMSTDYDGLPVIGDLVRLVVREQFNQKRGIAQRITRRIIAQETDSELDRRLEEALVTAEKELKQRLVGPLERLNLNPTVLSLNTTDKRIAIRYRVANEAQIAAHTPRPRAPSDSLLSMQLHQSSINNAIAQIGLSGRSWTIPELYERLGQVFNQSNWAVPQDIPDGISIRFADTRPATVEMEDGRMRLTLRIAELKQGDRLHITRFLVSSNYIPVAEGLNAELIRDGVVEIVSNRDRLALRMIFAKVFVDRPEIPLVSEAWQQDPRAEGLAVSQLDIKQGWLAVAISEAASERAAEVAERARELKLR